MAKKKEKNSEEAKKKEKEEAVSENSSDQQNEKDSTEKHSKNNPVLVDDDFKIISEELSNFTNSDYFKRIISGMEDKIRLGSTNEYSFYTNADNVFSSHQLNINDQINDLKRKLRDKTREVELAKKDGKLREAEIQELAGIVSELGSKEKLNHIASRIHSQAQNLLFEDDEFRNKFNDGESSDTVVVSIDIRRSTELMLKARTPDDFSKFITHLSGKLSDVIKNNFGIFDKFTGDGILAFFPKYYSGDKAIIRAIIAAEECHKVFADHYNASREAFNVFIKDVGLGIGVDFGKVTLVNSGNELTVVGIPVVYACRMSGAKAGQTLLNQPAKEEVCRLHGEEIAITEAEIEIKNEGTALAYEIELPSGLKKLDNPEWYKRSKDKDQ